MALPDLTDADLESRAVLKGLIAFYKKSNELQSEQIKGLEEILRAAREDICNRADKDERPEEWEIVKRIDAALK